MTDRLHQVYALLRSLADWEPPLRISVARGAIRGESPGRLEECQTCEGTGRRGNSQFPCRLCKGRGRVPVDPQTGHVVADEETTVEQLVRRRRTVCSGCGGSGKRTASTARDPGLRDVLELEPRTGRWHWRRAERETCQDCAGTGSRETVEMARVMRVQSTLDVVGDPLGVLAALERKQRQWQRGSYAQLEQRLGLLADQHPWAHGLLERHVIHPIGAVVSATVAAKLDWAVRWIEPGMPTPIVVPEEAMRELGKGELWRGRAPAHGVARRERDRRIAQLVANGTQPAEIASEYGLTSRRVGQIVNGTASTLYEQTG